MTQDMVRYVKIRTEVRRYWWPSVNSLIPHSSNYLVRCDI